MEEGVSPTTLPPPLANPQPFPSHQTYTGIPKLHRYPILLPYPAFRTTISRMRRSRQQTKRRPPGRFSTFQPPEQKTKHMGSPCHIQLAKAVQKRRRLYIPKLECSKTQLEDYVRNSTSLSNFRIGSQLCSVSWRLGNSFLPADRPDDGGVRSRTISVYHRP